MFGTFERRRRPRYDLGSFNPVWAAFHEWTGTAPDMWRAPVLRARFGYLVMPPGWSQDGSRDTSERSKARWAERERPWKKPTSSSSGADRAEQRRPGG